MGILVRDGYCVYQSWEGLQQNCLAHLIRTAQGLAESVEAGMARFGRAPTAVSYGHRATPVGQWRAWSARFRSLINQHTAREDNAGTLARRLEREGEALWVFLDVQGVEATNNTAEVRFVDQKPALYKVWGIGPEFKSAKALGLENLIPVSV